MRLATKEELLKRLSAAEKDNRVMRNFLLRLNSARIGMNDKAVRKTLDDIDSWFRKEGRGVMGEWQPIETAPKDGSEILTCNMNQGGVMSMIYWYKTMKQWRRKGEVIVCLQATHWMPLPDKPRKRGE